jgi:hypothetical protein
MLAPLRVDERAKRHDPEPLAPGICNQCFNKGKVDAPAAQGVWRVGMIGDYRLR